MQILIHTSLPKFLYSQKTHGGLLELIFSKNGFRRNKKLTTLNPPLEKPISYFKNEDNTPKHLKSIPYPYPTLQTHTQTQHPKSKTSI